MQDIEKRKEPLPIDWNQAICLYYVCLREREKRGFISK